MSEGGSSLIFLTVYGCLGHRTRHAVSCSGCASGLTERRPGIQFSVVARHPRTENKKWSDISPVPTVEQVPADAAVCPECGSDNETGWSDDAAYDDLFLYDDEPPADSLKPARWPRYLIAIVAALTLSAYLAYALAWGIYLIPLVLVAVSVAYYVTQVLPGQRHDQEKQVYQRLLHKAHGDKELVARLIEHERRRSPGADRLKLLQDVLYYWERDSR